MRQCCQLLSLWSSVQNIAIFHDLPATEDTGLHQIFGDFVFFHLFHTNIEYICVNVGTLLLLRCGGLWNHRLLLCVFDLLRLNPRPLLSQGQLEQVVQDLLRLCVIV